MNRSYNHENVNFRSQEMGFSPGSYEGSLIASSSAQERGIWTVDTEQLQKQTIAGLTPQDGAVVKMKTLGCQHSLFLNPQPKNPKFY